MEVVVIDFLLDLVSFSESLQLSSSEEWLVFFVVLLSFDYLFVVFPDLDEFVVVLVVVVDLALPFLVDEPELDLDAEPELDFDAEPELELDFDFELELLSDFLAAELELLLLLVSLLLVLFLLLLLLDFEALLLELSLLPVEVDLVVVDDVDLPDLAAFEELLESDDAFLVEADFDEAEADLDADEDFEADDDFEAEDDFEALDDLEDELFALFCFEELLDLAAEELPEDSLESSSPSSTVVVVTVVTVVVTSSSSQLESSSSDLWLSDLEDLDDDEEEDVSYLGC